jgi:hypothetical protein
MDESQLLELVGGDVLLFSRNTASCVGGAAKPGFDARGMCVAVSRSTTAGATWFGAWLVLRQ